MTNLGQDRVGDNESYNIDPDDDHTVPVHAGGRGLTGAPIEICHDLIATHSKAYANGARASQLALKQRSSNSRNDQFAPRTR